MNKEVEDIIYKDKRYWMYVKKSKEWICITNNNPKFKEMLKKIRGI